MPSQHPKSPVPWRRRREEYLRASARYDDLIKEGYMPASSRPNWSVIVGGQTNVRRIKSGNRTEPTEKGRTMTRLQGQARLVRETTAVIRHRALIIELSALTLRVRLKGARWSYEVDYESVFLLGAKKAAEKERAEKLEKRGRRARR